MITANSMLCTSLAIYHLVSEARLWNNCESVQYIIPKKKYVFIYWWDLASLKS